jgi:hypothetical protein
MSSSPRTPLVHPFTFFLVNGLTLSYNSVAVGLPNHSESMRALYWLTGFLDKKGQDKLEKEIKTMEKMLDGKQVITRGTFRELLTKIMEELHEEGYFLAAKGVFPMNPNPKHIGQQDYGDQ